MEEDKELERIQLEKLKRLMDESEGDKGKGCDYSGIFKF